MPKSFFDQVSADKSQLGFDYQDLVCLEYLIDLKPGETIGLEVFDDVHQQRISGTKSLVQVKHSVNETATLTNRDLDLWKTLSNWSKALDELGTDDVEFIFFTNKIKTPQSGFVQLLDSAKPDLKALIKAISDIKHKLDEKQKSKSAGAAENPVKKYVDHIYGLSDSKKETLLSKISMKFSTDDIFDRLTKKIEFFTLSKAVSLDVVHMLMGVFSKQKYKIVKSSSKVLIDYDMFRKQFQFNRIIGISQDRKIDFSRYHQFKNVNTIDPKEGIFAKQLADIDVSPEKITECAIEYAATSMFIQQLIVDGKFSETESAAIDEEVISGWDSLHSQKYNNSVIEENSEHKRVARDCFYSVGSISVQVANSSLSRAMVVGKGIELSDTCRIGWRKDWYDLYGINK